MSQLCENRKLKTIKDLSSAQVQYGSIQETLIFIELNLPHRGRPSSEYLITRFIPRNRMSNERSLIHWQGQSMSRVE
ncbi:hypothetical protein AG1IA_08735 [Rhizoctonia solani AG-1 IA]|uniref:Uncharacterized protein n=1 Tax=Thanatephorus cucumeris (strain AG1-IA) TaxID=983506 RepID=L8WKF6_THACA|nr:hypothetical protein AG1IA_08735 [Rhizoctonia solani AG-1 IA]